MVLKLDLTVNNKDNLSDNERYIVFSDIHGAYKNLRVLLRNLHGFRRTASICLGDIVHDGESYSEEKVIELMKEHPEIVSIKGNHDEDTLDTISDQSKLSIASCEYLDSLPKSLKIRRVIASHLSLKEPSRRLKSLESISEEADYIFGEDKTSDFALLGHTHKAGVYVYNPQNNKVEESVGKITQIKKGLKYLINPGVVTGEKPSLVILDLSQDEIVELSLDELSNMYADYCGISFFNEKIMPFLFNGALNLSSFDNTIEGLRRIADDGRFDYVIDLMKTYPLSLLSKKRLKKDFTLKLATFFSELITSKFVRNYSIIDPLSVRELYSSND